MATTGWIIAGTAGVVVFGGSNWNTPSNALTDDSAVTYAFSSDAEAYSYGLKLTNFNMAGVTDGSTINSISARFEKSYNSDGGATGYVRDHSTRLLKAGSEVGSDLANTGVDWPLDTLTNVDYGGTLWGTTWSAAEVKASDFGVIMYARFFGDEIDFTYANIDAVWINIDFTAPAGGNPKGPLGNPFFGPFGGAI